MRFLYMTFTKITPKTIEAFPPNVTCTTYDSLLFKHFGESRLPQNIQEKWFQRHPFPLNNPHAETDMARFKQFVLSTHGTPNTITSSSPDNNPESPMSLLWKMLCESLPPYYDKVTNYDVLRRRMLEECRSGQTTFVSGEPMTLAERRMHRAALRRRQARARRLYKRQEARRARLRQTGTGTGTTTSTIIDDSGDDDNDDPNDDDWNEETPHTIDTDNDDDDDDDDDDEGDNTSASGSSSDDSSSKNNDPRKTVDSPFYMIMIDESQDLSRVMFETLRYFTARLLYIGDPYQSIFGFEEGTMNVFDFYPSHPRYPLTESYRFSSAVANVANHIIQINHRRNEPQLMSRRPHKPLQRAGAGTSSGNGNGDEGVTTTFHSADLSDLRSIFTVYNDIRQLAIIARYNKTLVEIIINRDQLALNVKDLYLYGAQDLIDVLNTKDTTERRAYMDDLVRHYTRDTVERALTSVRDNQRDAQSARFVLMSCHRAKGLQFHSVFLCNDFAAPPSRAKKAPGMHASAEQVRRFEEEMRRERFEQRKLIYVAYTRVMAHVFLQPTMYRFIQDIVATPVTTTLDAYMLGGRGGGGVRPKTSAAVSEPLSRPSQQQHYLPSSIIYDDGNGDAHMALLKSVLQARGAITEGADRGTVVTMNQVRGYNGYNGSSSATVHALTNRVHQLLAQTRTTTTTTTRVPAFMSMSRLLSPAAAAAASAARHQRTFDVDVDSCEETEDETMPMLI